METGIGAAKALAAVKRQTRSDEGRMFTGEIGEALSNSVAVLYKRLPVSQGSKGERRR